MRFYLSALSPRPVLTTMFTRMKGLRIEGFDNEADFTWDGTTLVISKPPKPKRKRRTKAEMEVAKAEEQAVEGDDV